MGLGCWGWMATILLLGAVRWSRTRATGGVRRLRDEGPVWSDLDAAHKKEQRITHGRLMVAQTRKSVDGQTMRWFAAPVQVTAFDPAALSHGDAAALAAVSNAADAVDAPHLAAVDGDHVRLRHAYSWDMHPTHGLLVARGDDGDCVGYCEIHVSVWDNPTVAFLDLQTAPAHRGLGVGDVLLEAAVASAGADGRTSLIADGWVHGHRARFWQRHGWPVASTAAQRRLVLADLDHGRLDRLLAEAEAASADYEIVERPIPAPDDLVPALLDMHRVMNDAPLDDLDVEDDVWTVERHRGAEQALALRQMRTHSLLARRRCDGALAGFTDVVVEDARPQLGFQEDTAVAGAHRGHRLGLRLKAAMLRRLAEREPQLVHVDTWNAESNRHMIAVNEALGCVVVGRGLEVQRRLDV